MWADHVIVKLRIRLKEKLLSSFCQPHVNFLCNFFCPTRAFTFMKWKMPFQEHASTLKCQRTRFIWNSLVCHFNSDTESITKHLQRCTWKCLKIHDISWMWSFPLWQRDIFKMVTFPNCGFLPKIFLALRFASLYDHLNIYKFTNQKAWIVVTHLSGVVPKG